MADESLIADLRRVAATVDPAPAALSDTARRAASPPTRHSSSGRWGFESTRCAAGTDGCDDKACICLCHSRLGPYEQAPYGCPTCRTILNARAAGGCPDLWHSDNRPESAEAVPSMPDLADALARHLCGFDDCRPAPCADHVTTAGTVLKFLGNADADLPRHPAPDPGVALVDLHGEVEKCLGMLNRDGRLWVHAADRLPLLAAEVYAAVKAQPEPT